MSVEMVDGTSLRGTMYGIEDCGGYQLPALKERLK